MQQKAYNLIRKSETKMKKQNAQNLTSKSQNASKEGKLLSQTATVAPSLHIPSHIMQQTAKNLVVGQNA
jgi:hypothetical protein